MLQDSDVVEKISQAIPGSHVTIERTSCSSLSYKICVTSDHFANKTILQQHKMVKDAISDLLLSGIIHAVSLSTKTPNP